MSTDYGVFEASATDGHEEEQRQRQATKDLGRAIEAAREGFGDFLAGASDKDDYTDRLALVMNDLMQKVADAGVMPVPGVMRKVKAALRPEFRTAAPNAADMSDEELVDHFKQLQGIEKPTVEEMYRYDFAQEELRRRPGVKAALRPQFRQADAIDYYKEWCEENGKEWQEPSNVNAYGEAKNIPDYALHDIGDRLDSGADEVPDYGKDASRKHADGGYDSWRADMDKIEKIFDDADTWGDLAPDWALKSREQMIELGEEKGYITSRRRKKAGVYEDMVDFTGGHKGHSSFQDFKTFRETFGKNPLTEEDIQELSDRGVETTFTASRKKAGPGDGNGMKSEDEVSDLFDDGTTEDNFGSGSVDDNFEDDSEDNFEGGSEDNFKSSRRKTADINSVLDEQGVIDFFWDQWGENRALDTFAPGSEQWDWIKKNISKDDIVKAVNDMVAFGGYIDQSHADALIGDLGNTASRKQASDAEYEGWTAEIIYDEDDGSEYAETTTPSGDEADSIYPMDGNRFSGSELSEALQELAAEWGDDAYSGTYQYNSRRRQANSSADGFLLHLKDQGFSAPRDAGSPGSGGELDDELYDYFGGDEAKISEVERYLLENWSTVAYGSRKIAHDYEAIADRAAEDFERDTGMDPYTNPSFITQYLPAWASAHAREVAYDPALYEELEMEANMLGYGYTVESSRKQAVSDWSTATDEEVIMGLKALMKLVDENPESDSFYDFVETLKELARRGLGDDPRVIGSSRKYALDIDGSWEEELAGIGYASCTPRAGGGFEVYMWSDTQQSEAISHAPTSEEARQIWKDFRRQDIGGGGYGGDELFLGKVKTAGATSFVTSGTGATAQEAFQEAQQEARFEYGNGGYSGSIAEKDSFTMVTSGPVTDAEARALLNDGAVWDKYEDKFGPAGCIEVDNGDFVFFGIASE